MSTIQLTINGKHSEDSETVAKVQEVLQEDDSLFEWDSLIFQMQKTVYEVTGTPSFSRFTCEVTDEDQWTLNVEV